MAVTINPLLENVKEKHFIEFTNSKSDQSDSADGTIGAASGSYLILAALVAFNTAINMSTFQTSTLTSTYASTEQSIAQASNDAQMALYNAKLDPNNPNSDAGILKADPKDNATEYGPLLSADQAELNMVSSSFQVSQKALDPMISQFQQDPTQLMQSLSTIIAAIASVVQISQFIAQSIGKF